MSATAGQAQSERGLAERLGFKPGQVVQEFGFDDDVDEQLRASIAECTGNELVDEDYGDVVDAAVLWWRDDEEDDLTDVLVDVLATIEGGGIILVLTPKAGREGHVSPSDVAEAATTAGLSQTSAVSAGQDWSGTRLVAPKTHR
ncbi:DUF3052 domain-containing protein [Marinitenerispora sediminis]|uniref:DUF3052 domain-containing protein n=1 Tax=Marinitenerispora sediminis TaxID=1931232 RepID=A0A368T9G4_9ACTN|nr:DUF3052 domain-containing protein [Marinitenerispora sediminis]RCV54606.1 DUF3052 domain-containing protein [Marinitenerispora sediminis]RCV59839.1 DUF3052 domain-containing protein [Marinitenerispora sediminis]RCV61166.1 DUF3052 domain-containing protein [Marinitenerispora sediminis]